MTTEAVKDFVGRIVDIFLGGLTREQTKELVLACAVLVFGFHILIACGWLPFLSEHAYASSADVERLEQEINKQGERQLSDSIIKAQERVCKGLKDGNSSSVKYAAEQRREMENEYFLMTGRDFKLPTCDELGIS